MLVRMAAGVAAIVVVAGGYFLFNATFGPTDYSCNMPDPSPLADVGSPAVLQDCAVGKSVSISRGDTIAVDLQNVYGVDTYTEWRDLSVSDPSVLGTLRAPARIGIRPRSDEVAVYVGLRSGESEVTAFQLACRPLDSCGGRSRWRVTVHVS
jgi:hypothetical protein